MSIIEEIKIEKIPNVEKMPNMEKNAKYRENIENYRSENFNNDSKSRIVSM